MNSQATFQTGKAVLLNYHLNCANPLYGYSPFYFIMLTKTAASNVPNTLVQTSLLSKAFCLVCHCERKNSSLFLPFFLMKWFIELCEWHSFPSALLEVMARIMTLITALLNCKNWSNIIVKFNCQQSHELCTPWWRKPMCSA